MHGRMKNERDQLLFISSYPPRECGIATFTQDLINALNGIFDKTFDIKVCALHDGESSNGNYPKEVVYELDTGIPEKCIALAEDINNNERIISVVIQHEFGLFKGTYGSSVF